MAGNFADNGQALGDSGNWGVSLGDVDGDGDLDAWVAAVEGHLNRVWINQGGDQGGTSGDFFVSGLALGNGQLLGGYYSYGVSLGDLDNDGDLDAWVANGLDQANRVWTNQGGGSARDY